MKAILNGNHLGGHTGEEVPNGNRVVVRLEEGTQRQGVRLGEEGHEQGRAPCWW